MRFNIFPSSEDQIRLASPETLVTLIAACDSNKIGRFLAPPRPSALPGSAANKNDRLVLTSSTVRAMYDSTDRLMVVVSIQRKFLTKVPGSLNGWTCEAGSPMKFIEQQPGMKTVQLSR
jgi:hypothetical protein